MTSMVTAGEVLTVDSVQAPAAGERESGGGGWGVCDVDPRVVRAGQSRTLSLPGMRP